MAYSRDSIRFQDSEWLISRKNGPAPQAPRPEHAAHRPKPYVAYVLWPRWPDAPVALDAPSLPIVVAGVAFNIEPAAIRMPVQRRPGTQERVDLAYLWPSLVPPDPALQSHRRRAGRSQ